MLNHDDPRIAAGGSDDRLIRALGAVPTGDRARMAVLAYPLPSGRSPQLWDEVHRDLHADTLGILRAAQPAVIMLAFRADKLGREMTRGARSWLNDITVTAVNEVALDTTAHAVIYRTDQVLTVARRIRQFATRLQLVGGGTILTGDDLEDDSIHDLIVQATI